ncbi:MAG: LysR family transcriptional regulator [Microbacteriaceae bacterium]
MVDLRSVDVNLIVVLDAILSEKNLTRAGELAGMTPPAVSGALARLRQQYDDPLLVRVGRGFELTPRAEELIPQVREAMVEINRTLDMMPTFDPATSTRTFLIAASDYVLSEINRALLEVIDREAPGVNVSFDPLPRDQTVSPEDLLRRDVFIAASLRVIPGKRQSLFSDRFVCLVAKNNPRLVNGALSLNDLQDLRHVQASFGPGIPSQVADLLSAAGLSPTIGVTVPGFLAVPFHLQNTAMVGFVPERVAERYAETLGLQIAETPVNGVLVETAYWHPSRTNDPSLVWLLSKLREAAELVEFGHDTD